MTEALREWIIGLCGAAVVCALALAVCPAGRVRGVLRLVCAATMIIALVSPVIDFDFVSYAQALEKYRLEAEAAAGSFTGSEDNLSRSIIEDECSAYILDKAEELNLSASYAKVSARWSGEGFWYPYEAQLGISGPEAGREKLAELIESDLGIARERQSWG